MDFSTRDTTLDIREWQYLTGQDFARLDPVECLRS